MNSRILAGRCLRQLAKTSVNGTVLLPHVRYLAIIPISQHSMNVFMPKLSTPNLQFYRQKKKKAKKGKQDSDDEEEEEADVEEDFDDALPGDKEKILKTAQLRTDKILKLAFSNSRTIDTALLEGRVYRNGEKVVKKSAEVIEGDILDLEVGPDKNPDFIKVHRVEILEIKVAVHSMVRVHVSKNLTVKPFKTRLGD